MHQVITNRNNLVPEERLELSHPQRRRILNPLRLPFRHSGTESLLNTNIAIRQL